MSDDQQLPAKTPTDEAPLSEAEKLKLEVKKEREERAVAVTQQISELLQKSNCTVDVYLTIGTDGSSKGEMRVKAK